MAPVNIEESVDRISSLPDSILGHILSFLPTNVAVSTCILLNRSRWRDIFYFCNNLDFDLSLLNNLNDTSLFMDFVDRCILLKKGTRIDKFRLKCSDAMDLYVSIYGSSGIYSWICDALRSNVRVLDLHINTRELGTKFSYIFTCSTLVVLKLQGSGFFSLNVPASVYFPCLKTLHLQSIRFARYEESPIQRLVSSAPVLEDLLLVGSYMEKIVNLSSPSLKRLTIDKHKPFRYWEYELVLDMPSLVYLRFSPCIGEGLILKNLLALREAYICIPDWLEGRIAHHELLEGLSNVQSLYLYGNVEKFLRTLDVSEKLPLVKNLTRLVVTVTDTPYLKMYELMKLLKCCPNLEEFVTDGNIQGGYDVPCCVLPRLKSIECELFYNGRASLASTVESLGYFLENADMLEKIHIWWYSLLSQREASKKLETMMETIKQLAEAPSRSKTCEITSTIMSI